MTNAGQFSYDAIPVPAELDAVIDGAVRRYSREKGGRSFRKWAATAAAVLAVLFGCANIAPIYAAAENIPVIGTVVKVFHIGTGGEVTDGEDGLGVLHDAALSCWASLSAARAIQPSRASTSRIKCPLPSPPIAGLHDISPMVSSFWLSNKVRAPKRAEAVAASQPAWPPPMTTTSKV